jgi:hypothetical protein
LAAVPLLLASCVEQSISVNPGSKVPLSRNFIKTHQSITIGSGLKYPQGVAVEGRGNVYVADSGHSEATKVAPDSTITALTDGHQYRPRGVTCDPKGNFAFASFPKTGKIFQYRRHDFDIRGSVPQIAGTFYKPDALVLAVSAEPHGALYTVSSDNKVKYK